MLAMATLTMHTRRATCCSDRHPRPLTPHPSPSPGDDVLLAKLNCNDNRKFCEEAMAVDRFPTIRAFANGGADMENYEHNLDADAILAYVGHAMQARLAPP